MNEKLIMIVASMVKSAGAECEDFESRATAIFRRARINGLVTDEETQLQGGILAIMSLYTDEDNDEMIERINQEMQALKTLEAMLSGVPIDADCLIERELEREPLALMKLWHETGATQ